MAQPPAAKSLGWGTRTTQTEKRERLHERTQADDAKQDERDRRIAARARLIRDLVQSEFWPPVEEIFKEQFGDLVEILSGSGDLHSDNLLGLVGSLRATRALWESFDSRLKTGEAAFDRINLRHLTAVTAVKAERPPQVARQPVV